ncbi:MAG: glucose-methanol-choline oxidoreductase [Acidobacteria bacterium]|jgi:choline dehydrogenase-like flavoprotein|nr:glucose-methanol-choline oxidoreductase [Acidobacteriota bacterium]MDP7338371.1 GMC family oxidoreductase [Vicinamibacterales bacterium]HJN46105.1 GMC family oxidoreductase [Vicinamibacterales bacterium]|tara:strand:+ start:1091 stop:2761 length:1671 start_codon:yes stop_codon:yes gene_type:complete
MTQFTPATEVDFVVIGSGAAGGIMAKQLSVAGFSVVVLEQGEWGKYGHEQDYTKDELLNRNVSPEDRLTSNRGRQPNTFRRTDGDQTGPGSHSYGCVVGGGTVTYGGSSWRHLPWEFNEASTVGTIAGTGMADWPISYEELEPYYTQAEWEMGMSGQRVDSPFVAPMSKEYPVPPVPLKASGALFNVAAAKLGLTVVPGPLAIITQPYMGRSGCVNCGMCSGFGCHVRARSSSAVTVLPIAVETGNCEIRARSYVREISVDDSGRVTGVIYFNAQKQEVIQKAKAVVLSANAGESARLLLMSKSARFPDGLANSSGVVGRYLMLGNGAGASGLFEHPLNDYKGVVSGTGIVDYVPSDPKRGFYGGGRLTSRGYATPISYGLGGLSPGVPRWGAGYKQALRDEAGHKMAINCFVTQLPLETNRVDLDPEVKDEWGLPAMRITSKSHPDDIKAMEFFRQKSIEILEAAGAKRVWAGPVRDSRGGAHNRGTCRMGNDPKTSVVDKFHRAHDVSNLFIVDGSNLVTGGRNHPTMTIQALAFRAAEHLVRAATSGNLSSSA